MKHNTQNIFIQIKVIQTLKISPTYGKKNPNPAWKHEKGLLQYYPMQQGLTKTE